MQPLLHASFARRLARRQWVGMFAAGTGVAVVIAVLGACRFGPVERVDNAVLDTFVRVFASGAQARHTVVVDIDDVSLSAVGQWPWPRYRIASLIDRIAAQKPAAIALDILFPEEDRSSLANIQQTYKRDFGIDVSFAGLPDGMLDNDGFLGHEIARAGVVGSTYFYFDHTSKAEAPPRPGVGFEGRTDLLTLDEAPGVMTNAAAIASQTRSSGFVNSMPDHDGALRRVPMLIGHHGVIHPSLSLAAVMQALGASSGAIESGRQGLDIRVGDHRIPIDASGSAALRFEGGPSAYPSVSAVDILNGKFDEADLRGKIVFIGTSAVGLNDFHRTAVDPLFPGLKVQSVMAESILQDRLVGTPVWGGAVSFAACLVAGALLSGIFVASSNAVAFVGVSVLAGAGLLAASAIMYARSGLVVRAGAPLLVVATLFASSFVLRALLEKRRALVWRRQLENARQVTIESMASVAETRDPETGAHIKRTQNYVRAIAEELKKCGHYPDLLSKQFIELLFVSAPLHDIGKVGVPDHILLKPGKLTPAEMEIMKQHAEFGAKIIRSTSARIEGDNFLVIAGEIAATHHEKWDGTGYPRGLRGDDIPLSGRIMAVADIYDALISRRCYKEPFTHAHSTSLMREMRGTTFDPTVLDAFFRIEPAILRIAANFKDAEELGVAESRAMGGSGTQEMHPNCR
jgi:HD-GYP domain-containing protein (c-di-GMP phosphodiesterase class II)